VSRERLLDGRVPACRMGDLVSDHVGELVLVVDEDQQAAGDEDVAARQREGVGLELIDDLELVVEAATRHAAQQLLPDLVHVGIEIRIVDDPDRPGHLVCTFATDADVVVLGVQDRTLLLGLLSGRARARSEDERGDAEQRSAAEDSMQAHGAQGSSLTQEPSENHFALSWVSSPVPSRVLR
jgi:hypothetical protein